jgi:hypothetical protein
MSTPTAKKEKTMKNVTQPPTQRTDEKTFEEEVANVQFLWGTTPRTVLEDVMRTTWIAAHALDVDDPSLVVEDVSAQLREAYALLSAVSKELQRQTCRDEDLEKAAAEVRASERARTMARALSAKGERHCWIVWGFILRRLDEHVGLDMKISGSYADLCATPPPGTSTGPSNVINMFDRGRAKKES